MKLSYAWEKTCDAARGLACGKADLRERLRIAHAYLRVLQVHKIPDVQLAEKLDRILEKQITATMREDEAADLAGEIFDLHCEVQKKHDQ